MGNKTAKEILSQMTTDEKIVLLTGGEGVLQTAGVPRLNIAPKNMADGPNGERNETPGSNCTTLPSGCAVGATWNPDLARLTGETIARDCIHHDVQMILGPAINMKRNALCGRNFEYFSEDPVLSGELAAAYIRGCEDLGVGTSLKHFACNSQELRRTFTNVEIDERTMREIYLRAFEIAVKKAKPASVMCAYNKISSMWCSENKMLLSDIPRDEWGYEGIMVSDWGAVHAPVKALRAGLDLCMPYDDRVFPDVKKALADGRITEEQIDKSALRVLEFLSRDVPEDKGYDRKVQHENALRVARESIVLLRNENRRAKDGKDTGEKLLPLQNGKLKKIAVTGEYAVLPYINGQGSAEVKTEKEWIDTPLDCLRRELPDVQVDYFPYLTRKEPDTMLWHTFHRDMPDIASYDAVLVFTGNQPSQDSENMDRADNHLAAYVEHVLYSITSNNPNVVLVLCSGSSTFKGDMSDRCGAILQMWTDGEAGGQAIAEILSGKTNPSGKLSETFSVEMRHDMDLLGDGLKIDYGEKWAIGYRYYDLHPEKVWFPFGHGLSYTTFGYENAAIEQDGSRWRVSLDLRNTGNVPGAEVVQLYVGDPVSTVSKPKKELKAFRKVFLAAGETARVEFTLGAEDLSYYNTMLHAWVVENGRYDVFLASSAQDVRAALALDYYDPDCYTIQRVREDMIAE